MSLARRYRYVLIALLAAIVIVIPLSSRGSSHREAPITALDHKADITDVYAFVSYDAQTQTGEAPTTATLVMCVDPLLEPGNGPTLFPFDPDILYEIKIDNDRDAVEDVVFSFRFATEFRAPGLFTSVAGIGASGANAPGTGTPVVPPRIDSFDSPGLNLRQSYVMTARRGAAVARFDEANGAPLYVVPGNAGPRTMDYAALYQAGTYQLPQGMQVFAGTVDDPFYIDLGATFDTANFRTLGSGIPGVLTPAEDAAQQNFASDTVSGFAVNAIAVQVPIAFLTSTGQVEPATSADATIGVWATTSRRQVTIRRDLDSPLGAGPWRQVQRLGNPLINELLIGIGSKDRWSMDKPQFDSQFVNFLVDPPFVKVVEALYGGALSVPSAPRVDLLPLIAYAPPLVPAGTAPGPIADMLRLNTGISATPIAQQSRLGVLGGDLAGFPNGRRLADDAVDIALRVVAGGVLDPAFQMSPNDRLGDGVNVNDAPLQTAFPYLALCPSGRDRRHVDPGEPGGGPVN